MDSSSDENVCTWYFRRTCQIAATSFNCSALPVSNGAANSRTRDNKVRRRQRVAKPTGSARRSCPTPAAASIARATSVPAPSQPSPSRSTSGRNRRGDDVARVMRRIDQHHPAQRRHRQRHNRSAHPPTSNAASPRSYQEQRPQPADASARRRSVWLLRKPSAPDEAAGPRTLMRDSDMACLAVSVATRQLH